MPGCASEMDRRTPAFSGYTRRAPADNQSSGEKQQHTHSVFNYKGNTNKAVRCCLVCSSLFCLSRKRTGYLSVSIRIEPKLNFVTGKVAVKGGFGTNTTCRHPSHAHLLAESSQVSVVLLLCFYVARHVGRLPLALSDSKAWE